MSRLHYHAGDIMFYVRTNTLDIDIIRAVFENNIYLPKSRGFSLKRGDTVVDLGAYIGDFSLYARQRGARVIAVEPFADNYNLLLENAQLNELDVEHCRYAISDTAGVEDFYVNRGNYGACGFNSDYRIINQEKIEIDTITLKTLFDIYNIKECALLKFDTEGAELTYFDDFPYFDRIKQITGECPSDEISKHLRKLFESKGFQVEFERVLDGENIVYAKKV